MFLVLSLFGYVFEVSFHKEKKMGLASLTSQVAKNGTTITDAIAAGIGIPPATTSTGTTDAQLDVLEQAIAADDARLQKAIDDAKANGGGPVPPPVPTTLNVASIDTPTIAAGATASVTLKGTGFTGGVAVGTGALSFANGKVVDDSTITVDVTVAAGTAPGTQTIGVQVGAVTSNELPIATT